MKTTTALNPKQVELLKFISKFRFVTVAHIQNNFNLKSRPSVNLKLNVLIKTGHIGRLYDRSYRQVNKPASFYLTPKGLREIQKHLPYITDAIIKNSYGDKRASDSLVDESARLLELSKSLATNYPAIKALTARQLGDIEYMPKPLPSLYLALKVGDSTSRYFLYYLQDSKRYDVAVSSKIARLVKYRESEDYARSGNDFPVILLVCDSAAIERLAGRTIGSALNKSFESMQAYTTSHQSLLQQRSRDRALWSSVDDPDSLISLDDIESSS